MTAIKVFVCLLALTLLLSLPAPAQTVGHLNLGNLIERMPDTRTADAQLKSYQEGLEQQIKIAADALERDAKNLDERYKNGEVTLFEVQTALVDLKEKESKILSQEQENLSKVQDKRAELLIPIIKKIESALRAVASRNQIELVFDTSIFNTVLFAKDSADVMSLVEQELGIANASSAGLSFREARTGRLVSSAVLSEMPEVRQMRSTLDSLQIQLQKQGQRMVEDFQSTQSAAAQKEERGELSPKEKETVLKDLQERQSKILAFEKQSQEDLVKREEQMLKPILDKVNNAIRNVSNSNGVDFVLDSSVLICCEDSLDMTSRTKTVVNGGSAADSAIQSAGVANIGYLNSAAILAEMSEVRSMNAVLEGLRTQFQRQGQAMVDEFRNKQQDAAQREERGELSPVEKQTILIDLQAKQEKILNFERQMQDDLIKKEQELLSPILKKVNDAIDAAAAEKGIHIVVESSVLIYGGDAYDLTDSVKAKL